MGLKSICLWLITIYYNKFWYKTPTNTVHFYTYPTNETQKFQLKTLSSDSRCHYFSALHPKTPTIKQKTAVYV